jgi:hypothetical protein
MEQMIKQLWKLWKDHDDAEGTNRTWCNYFVTTVCMEIGYYGFSSGHTDLSMVKWPLTANAIHRKLSNDIGNWTKVHTLHAAYLASMGNFVIAARSAKGHGHVAIITPGQQVDKMPYSSKWSKAVPTCANIGGSNFWGKGVNWAFRTEPDYYLYHKDATHEE